MDIAIEMLEGKKVRATVGGHEIVTDQPHDAGGEDTGPSPFTLFLASLGTCAGFYVSSFCQARGISTAGVRITQHNHFDATTHRLVSVDLELELPDGFPTRYNDALRAVVDKCAVKRAINDPPGISVTVKASIESGAQHP